jgi:hypothetical protein
MNPSLRIISIVACAGLSACMGRPPTLMAVVQPQDRQTNCEAIMAEVASNTQQIGALGREDGAKVAQNVIMGVAGVFVPVLWLAMDFQNASGKEGTALQQRNAYLASLAETRCNAPVIAGLAGGTAMDHGVASVTNSAAVTEVAKPVAIQSTANQSNAATVNPNTNIVVDGERGPPRF